MALAVRQGRARAGWDELQPMLRRMTGSFYTRTAFVGLVAPLAAGWAAAAAADTADGPERLELTRAAGRWAGRVPPARVAATGAARAAAACARRDREAAVVALRGILGAGRVPPVMRNATHRVLGALVGGDEGRALVQQADAFFTAAGVADPEPYAASLLPGIAIR